MLLEKSNGEWRIEHQDVPYDVGETLARLKEADYLGKIGPIGRLIGANWRQAPIT